MGEEKTEGSRFLFAEIHPCPVTRAFVLLNSGEVKYA